MKKQLLASAIIAAISTSSFATPEDPTYNFVIRNLSEEALEKVFVANYDIDGTVGLSQETINLGDSVNVNWNLDGYINDVTINGTSKGASPSGTDTVFPTTTGTINFYAVNDERNIERNLPIRVENWINTSSLFTSWIDTSPAYDHTD